MLPNFSPGGRAHRLLARLADGPASLSALAEVIRGPNQTQRGARNRAHRFLIQLLGAGYAARCGDGALITASGVEALKRLGPLATSEAGEPNVRIFGRAA